MGRACALPKLWRSEGPKQEGERNEDAPRRQEASDDQSITSLSSQRFWPSADTVLADNPTAAATAQ